MKWHDYPCIASTRKSFIQQVVCGWVRNGYVFYVHVLIPEDKNPYFVDRKLLCRYAIAMKASRRRSRKNRGVIRIAYVRHGRNALMLATHGRHEETKEGWLDWRATEGRNIRDCSRGQPIKVYGYSIYYVRGGYVLNRTKTNPSGPPERDYEYHVRAQISRKFIAEISRHLLAHATRRDEEWFASQFWHLPFEPFAPVRKQLLKCLMQVNQARRKAGLSKLPTEIIRFRRDIVKVYRDRAESKPQCHLRPSISSIKSK